MGYIIALVVAALCIELVVRVNTRKSGGVAFDKAKSAAVPIFSKGDSQRKYLPAEIRVMDKEAQYRRERRAAQMGYCLLPRQANFRGLPGQHQA